MCAAGCVGPDITSLIQSLKASFDGQFPLLASGFMIVEQNWRYDLDWTSVVCDMYKLSLFLKPKFRWPGGDIT